MGGIVPMAEANQRKHDLRDQHGRARDQREKKNVMHEVRNGSGEAGSLTNLATTS
jgi:hypothetical protein